MLIKCPECELQISDKANACPHCGYPINSPKPSRKSTKHKRLPNGFGQITEIKNKNLRNPYRVMVTVGKTTEGKPIQKLLKPQAYFHTYNEAYEALIEYNRNPYDLSPDLLLYQLYDRWSEEYFKTYSSPSSIRTVKSAWSYCSEIYNMRVKDVRARHIKGCMENGTVDGKTPTGGIKSRIKSLFNQMLDYAVEYELVDRNYARTFSVSDEIIKEISETKRGHISFTDEEMDKLWENINLPYVKLILIQCYMGWRPQELGLIRLDCIDWEHLIVTGGMKTPAGIARKVPIHSKIEQFVREYHAEAVSLNSEYLFNCTDGDTHKSSLKMTYEKYHYRFDGIISRLELNPEHRPHDPRKQFVTMAKKYKVDEYAIKYMVGHNIKDITEAVYTSRDPEWFKEEIEKIK